MPPRRSSARKASKAPKAEPEVIELSSDSEPETTETPQPKEQEEQEEHGTEQIETKVATPEVYDQPLLRAAGIRYKSDKLTERQQQQQQQPQQQQQEEESTPDAKLAVRFKETGSVKHRHVSIEIPVQSPSSSKSKVKDDGATDNHNDHEQEVFKTPMERRHITFDESDHDEFVTPSDFPKKNPLEIAAPPQSNTRADTVQDSAEEVDDDSDDEAPEAVSTRVAEAQTKAEASKAAQAAAKAAEKEAAVLKRKRQERDAIFKQQAKERKQVLEQEKRQAAAAEELALGRGEKSAGEVPKLLPLELLESDDEDEDEADRAESGGKGLNKRRKLDGSVQRLLRESRARVTNKLALRSIGLWRAGRRKAGAKSKETFDGSQGDPSQERQETTS